MVPTLSYDHLVPPDNEMEQCINANDVVNLFKYYRTYCICFNQEVLCFDVKIIDGRVF